MNQFKNKKYYWIPGLILALAGLAIFLIPENAFAEKLYEVLKQTGNNQPGGIVRKVWQTVLQIVNYAVIGVLIFIAFANILRININVYSIKKVLPVLFLATIAANFSFLFCRVFVDLSNVTFDLFINYGGAGIEMDNPNGEFPTTIAGVCDTTAHPDVKIGIARAFCAGSNLQNDLISGGALDWAVVGKLLFYSILQLVGTVFIYILAFLFYIRNYVVYFLVALSPLAFMSMVLPVTKQVWSMWWKNFMQWVFLPTLSLFWLWLGSQWMSFGINTGGFSIMSAAFAGVCYYLAITTPFKMGGAVLGSWAGAGKKIWGATGGKAVDYQTAKGTAAWQARVNNAQSAIKLNTGWGKGLDMEKQKLADSETRRTGVSDKYQGEYVARRGAKRAEWAVKNKELEGNVAFNEAMELKKALEDPGSLERIKGMRRASQGAIARLETAEADFKTLEMNLREEFFNGGKNAEGEWVVKHETNEDGVEEATHDDDGYMIPLDKDDKGFIEKQKFLAEYGGKLWNATNAENRATKAAGDVMENAVLERQQLDNIGTEIKELAKIERDILELEKLKARVGKETAESEDEDEIAKIEAKLKSKEYDMDGDLQGQNKEKQDNANSNMTTAAKRIQERMDKTGGDVPVHLQDMLKRNSSGQITGFKSLDKLEKSRMGKWIQTEVMSGGMQQVLESYSGTEQIDSLRYGNTTEGIEASELKAYFTGNGAANKPGKNEKIQRFIRASASKMNNRNNSESKSSMTGLLNVLDEHGNHAGIDRIIKNSKKIYEESGGDEDSVITAFDNAGSAEEIIHIATDRDSKDGEAAWRAVANAVGSSEDLGLRGNGAANL